MNRVEQSVKVYDSIAQKYSDVFDADLSDNPRIDRFVSYLPENGLVIDVGCGTGVVTKYIQSKGIQVQGIDLSASMLKIAAKNYPQINFKQEDIRDMEYQDDYFDGIWAGHSLFHLTREEFVSALLKFNEILKEKGIFGFVINEGSGDIEVPEPLDPNLIMPLTLYTENELVEMLDKANFKILEKDYKEPIQNSDFKPYRKLFILAGKK